LAEKGQIFPRTVLDAGGNKNPNAPKPWQQVVAEKFNNPNWIVETECLPDLYFDEFQDSKTITLDAVEGTIMPEQVEVKFHDSRLLLIKASLPSSSPIRLLTGLLFYLLFYVIHFWQHVVPHTCNDCSSNHQDVFLTFVFIR
jgi:hypothetical protein